MNATDAAVHARPRTVVILKLDTLGDLILFAPALAALRKAWPEARVVVVIRRAYLDLAALLVPRIEWITTTLDPFAQGPETDPVELNRLRSLVEQAKEELAADKPPKKFRELFHVVNTIVNEEARK